MNQVSLHTQIHVRDDWLQKLNNLHNGLKMQNFTISGKGEERGEKKKKKLIEILNIWA